MAGAREVVRGGGMAATGAATRGISSTGASGGGGGEPLFDRFERDFELGAGVDSSSLSSSTAFDLPFRELFGVARALLLSAVLVSDLTMLLVFRLGGSTTIASLSRSSSSYSLCLARSRRRRSRSISRSSSSARSRSRSSRSSRSASSAARRRSSRARKTLLRPVPARTGVAPSGPPLLILRE